MAQFTGRATVVNVSVDNATWHPVGEVNSADMALSGATLDVTKLGDNVIERILGLVDCQWTLAGFYDPTDTNGQVAVRSSLLSNTPLYVQVLFNPGGSAGAKGFSQQVVCSKYEPAAQVAGVVTFSMQLDGDGPITAV